MMENRTKIFIWSPSSLPFNSLHLQARSMHLIIEKYIDNCVLITPEDTKIIDLIKLLLNRNYKIVWHFGAFDPKLFLLYFFKNIIVVYHNITPWKYFIKSKPLVALKSMFGRIQLFCLPRNRQYVAVSPYNSLELTGAGKKHISIVPCSLNKNNNNVFKKSKYPTIFFNGRIAENKGLTRLFKIIDNAFIEYDRKVLFILNANGELKGIDKYFYQQSYKKLKANKNVKIIWTKGDISEEKLKKIYQYSWLYVTAAEHEGFGLPVFESIINGTPALYVACGGTESVLEELGLVRLDREHSFEDRLRSLLSDSTLRSDLSDKQLAHLENFYHRYPVEGIVKLVR